MKLDDKHKKLNKHNDQSEHKQGDEVPTYDDDAQVGEVQTETPNSNEGANVGDVRQGSGSDLSVASGDGNEMLMGGGRRKNKTLQASKNKTKRSKER